MSSAAEMAFSPYPQLPGFAKENKELVYAMIEAGWKGRVTSKGHWLGKAPDGTTQITVPAKNGNNRGLKNAHATFMRWLKEHVPAEEKKLWDAAVQEDNPIVQDVIAEGLVRKQTTRLVQENMQRAHEEFIDMITKDPRVTIEPLIRPWLARKQPGPNGGTRYESQAVLERIWPDGRTDYTCSFPRCDYVNDKPVSVARHFGAAHTRNGNVQPAAEGPLHPDPTYTEPTQTRDYRPTQRLVDTLGDLLESLRGKDIEEMAVAVLTWMHERPDIEHESRPLVPLTDRQVLDKIRMLVGQPDQSEEIAGLKAENLLLADEIVRLKEERRALRDLLTEE